ncbi:MAG TPA: hypothetical protein PKK52_11715, partial [Syntrophorhabdus sp.]|nr:hypothetical protein [Syntrophorhabdus sp.]
PGKREKNKTKISSLRYLMYRDFLMRKQPLPGCLNGLDDRNIHLHCTDISFKPYPLEYNSRREET